MQLYCTQTQTDSEQQRQTQALDCNSSTLQIHVTLQPSPDYLSPFYGSCFQAEQPGKTWPEVKFMFTERKICIQEKSTETVCLHAITSLKHHSIHVTQAHCSLTARQYPQSLIKWAFDLTLKDEGSQPLGWEGPTSSRLHSWVCTMYVNSYLHVNPEVSKRGSSKRAL